jgi:hypothetical protein
MFGTGLAIVVCILLAVLVILWHRSRMLEVIVDKQKVVDENKETKFKLNMSALGTFPTTGLDTTQSRIIASYRNS